eukprot:TRINITY_DN96513_c0_g1_i1.p1 TRINITY_DN96513_c0_g1~~TRINITY_DN96513_c0_g1_i1.p1  ORF type:complete len:254 (-),score=33.66 TRINITY_DN96513_c0_g1_i1:14-775(-)
MPPAFLDVHASHNLAVHEHASDGATCTKPEVAVHRDLPALVTPGHGLQHHAGRHPSAFWIDCSRFEGWRMLWGRLQCWKVKRSFKKRIMMDQMPTDRNCKAITFVLDRRRKQWYKCCKQGSFLFPKQKCIEATPTQWFTQRNEFMVSMPFERKDVQMCFRTKVRDQNCPDKYCNNFQEKCVRIGELGKDASWIFPEVPKGALSALAKLRAAIKSQYVPEVNVFVLQMPAPMLLSPAHAVSGICNPARKHAEFL